MTKPLNILIVEDSQDDADLILAELKYAGFAVKWERVDSEAAFLAGIKTSPDIIFSDSTMPCFSGLKAVALLRASGLKIPFILISGSGDKVVGEAIKQGATDCLPKDNISRLGKIVEEVLKQKGDNSPPIE